MKLSDLIQAQALRSDTEGDKHVLGKARLVTLLNEYPGLIKLFTCGDEELRVGGDVKAEPEVGWPKVMPRCTFESYWAKRGEPPEYMFDVGVFRDNELIGVCEILSASKTYLPKLKGVLRSGLWLIEVSCRDLSRATRADRPDGLIEIPCVKVFKP
jgi:hypothetical protein